MNEQLQQAVTALISKSLEAFQAGADFLAAEIPDVIYQLLLWNMVYHAAMFLIGVGGLLLLVYLNYKQWKWWKEPVPYYSMRILSEFGIFAAFNVFQALPIIALIQLMNLEWLKIWIAPKIWLIEYAASLVK